MRRPDNNHHERRPSCLRTGDDDASSRQPADTAVPEDWTHFTDDHMLDFAQELSDDMLCHLPVIAREHCLIAVLADIVDAVTGAVSAKLILAEPRYPNANDTLGLIVLPPGAQPGDGILFTRTRA